MLDTEDSLKEMALRIYSAQYAETQGVVASVVHETNNILSILLGALEAVQDLADDEAEIDREELKEEVEALRRNMGRLTENMADLRKVYRPSKSGKSESNIQQVFNNVKSLFDFKLKRNRIVYEVGEAPDSVIPVPVAELSMLFSIFFANSVEAAAKNEDITLKLNIRFGFEGDFEFTEFETSGVAMSPEVAEKLGEAFVTDKDPKDHLGLGIFVAKELLNKYKGQLKWDVSDETVKFRLLLPSKF